MGHGGAGAAAIPAVAVQRHREALARLETIFPADLQQLLWLVGGAVRDLLSGEELRDIDLVAALPAGRLKALGFREVIAKSSAPIWFRHLPGFGAIELTLIASPADLVADLGRRDFSINAMALTLAGDLIDPLDGSAALRSRTLRLCSATAISDDPLRAFRAFRFVAEGFVLDEDSARIISDSCSNELLQQIPVERFSRELLKALAAPHPERFFRGMLEFELGRHWLPELFSMARVPAGPLQYHPEGDLLTHSFQVLERLAAATDSPLARFCGLFHDLGKLATDPGLYPKHHGHEEAGFKTAERFCRRLALPLEYGKALAWISRLHGNANRLEQLRPATRIRMAEQAMRAGIDAILPQVAAADKGGGAIGAEWQQAVAVAAMSCDQLGIDQAKLLAMKPGKRGDMILQRRVEYLRKGF